MGTIQGELIKVVLKRFGDALERPDRKVKQTVAGNEDQHDGDQYYVAMSSASTLYTFFEPIFAEP
jgi:hypothetical protein